jgi:hypothetical protein
MEEFVKIADDAIDANKEELAKVLDNILMSALANLYNKGLEARNYTDEARTSYTDSWEWILLRQRMSESIKMAFDLDAITRNSFELVNMFEGITAIGLDLPKEEE